MSNNRTLILREPGHIILDAAGTPATFYSEVPWTVEMMEEVVALPSAMFGDLDRIPVGRLVKIKGIVQQFSDDAVGRLFPFAAKARGASALGSTDMTVDLHTTTGKRCRIPNGFVYKEPDIRGDVRKTPFGEVEIWGIVPLSGNGNALANFFAETAVSYPGDSLFDTSAIITPAWTVMLGATAIDLADSGFSIKTTPKLVEDKVNGVGTYNVAITDYGVEFEVEPMNLTRAAVMAMAGWGNALGSRKSAAAMEIVCTGTGIYVAVRGAALVPGANFSFGAEPRAVGKLKFQSTRSFSEGAEVAQLYVGEAEPA